MQVHFRRYSICFLQLVCTPLSGFVAVINLNPFMLWPELVSSEKFLFGCVLGQIVMLPTWFDVYVYVSHLM